MFSGFFRAHYHYNHEESNAVQGTIITESVQKTSGRTDLVLRIFQMKIIKATHSSSSPIKVRTPGNAFNFRLNCMLCGTLISSSSSISDPSSMVQTMRLQRSFQRIANSMNDSWGRAVAGRMNSIIGLPTADACCHHSCNSNFRTGKDIPQKYSNNPKRRKPGRPVDEKKKEAFHEVFIFFKALLEI